MPTPSATYRIQFHLNFRFRDAEELVPYLHALGITHLYASPRFRARKGSLHGYDVADSGRVNSELGTEEEFQSLVNRLHNYGMGLMLDIVPNHMAASEENPWWMDLLENGRQSEYATYFDIDWEADPLKRSRILLPILGESYGQVLESRGLSLHYDDQGFFVRYYQMRFPIRPETYGQILSACLEELENSKESANGLGRTVKHTCELFDELGGSSEAAPVTGNERRSKIAELKNELWELYREPGVFQKAVDQTLRVFNGIKGVRRSFDRLDRLLSSQAYRLAYWRRASEEINYRRFFDINELVGIRTDNPKVFEARHAPILRLLKDGAVDGLRIDHIDGLRDPLAYLYNLRKRIGEEGGVPKDARRDNSREPYIVVEKILSGSEGLPPEWPVEGTTGYDFVNAANVLFVEPSGYRYLERLYQRVTGDESSFAQTWYRTKKQVMEQLFGAEVRSLSARIVRLASMDRKACDLPFTELQSTLKEITASLSVYRTYVREQRISKNDLLQLERAIQAAGERAQKDQNKREVLSFFRRLFRREPDSVDCSWPREWLEFMLRWQMFTGAVMAKGFEDTAFYRHNVLISLNEVGSDPIGAEQIFGLEAFHRFNDARRGQWPQTMNATSTHDTKRSEDVRARIHVLSEIPQEWHTRFRRWSSWNRDKRVTDKGRTVPSASEELLIYQTLLGAWPLEDSELEQFRERLLAFIIKAAREAKQSTNWLNPEEAHETRQFVSQILDASSALRFLIDFRRFQRRIAFHGALNSLSQVLLKIAAPGNPDIYQGNELWDFSMTDPDNRRPIDFKKRASFLENLQRTAGENVQLASLLHNWTDGRIKFFLTNKALEFRRSHAELFAKGDYVPLYASNRMSQHVCAFMRTYKGESVLVAVPRFTTALTARGEFPLRIRIWRKHRLELPRGRARTWSNILTGERLKSGGSSGEVLLSNVFSEFPVALLYSAQRRSKLPFG
jgi:(1->4)-alpha-D-glucan 1-alpha-D-glucosylmutase